MQLARASLALAALLFLGCSTHPGPAPPAQPPAVREDPLAHPDSGTLLEFLKRQGGALAEITSAELASLEVVRLDQDYTHGELASLAALPSLREVMIWRDGDSFPGAVGADAPTDADLKVLATLQQVTTLRIGGWSAPYTDAGVAHLEPMAGLQHLLLIESQQITDEAMQSVARMPALETLNITYTHISDDGLEALMASKSLKSVRYGWAEDSRRWLATFRLRHRDAAFEIL